MIWHTDIENSELRHLIKSGHIKVAGNIRLKIYGTLGCKSGKRMKRNNRVFFKNEDEAIMEGYRPCGNCMRDSYNAFFESNQLS